MTDVNTTISPFATSQLGGFVKLQGESLCVYFDPKVEKNTVALKGASVMIGDFAVLCASEAAAVQAVKDIAQQIKAMKPQQSKQRWQPCH